MAAPAGNAYSGALNAGVTSTLKTFKLPDMVNAVAICVYSLYAAVAGTTGVDVLVGYSIDGGISYSDPASLGIVTTPTAGVASQKMKNVLQDGSFATHISVQVKNLDLTNNATDVEVFFFPKAGR